MSDVFISYSREDREQAELLARALAAQGWSVWWDLSIPAGRIFDDVIEEEIHAARCIVVLWSKRSVASRWVRAEAEVGASRNRLVPVTIEEVTIPLAFRRIQAANLVGWDGDATASHFQSLVQDIAAMLAAAVSDEDRVPLPADASRPVEERPGQVEVGSREPRPEAVARLGAGESGHGQKRRASGFPGSFGLWLGGTALLVAIGLGLTFALERGPWTRGSESDIPSGQMNGGKSEGPQEREEAQKTGTTAGQETIEKGTFSGSSEAATLGRSGVAEDAPAGGSDQPQGEGTPPPTTSRPATRLQTEPVEGVQEPPPETVPRARVQAEPETMGRGTTSWSSETASPGRARTVEDAPAGESNQPQGEGTPPPTTSEPSSRQTREPAVTQADTSSKTGSQTACTDDIAVVIAVDSRYREAVLSKFGVLRIGKAGCWQMELRFQEPRVSDAARGGGSIWKACDVEASFHLRYKNQDIVDTTIRRNAVKLEEPQACSAAARDVATAAVRKVAVRCAECTVPRSGS